MDEQFPYGQIKKNKTWLEFFYLSYKLVPQYYFIIYD